MVIGSIDKIVTAKKQRKVERIEKAEARQMEEDKRQKTFEKKIEQVESDDNCEELTTDPSPDKGPKMKRGKYITKKKYKALQPVFETAERFNLSDNAIAHMMNATGFASAENENETQQEIIIQSRVNKLKRKLRAHKVEESKGKSPIAIGMDERKDACRVLVGVGEKGKKRYETQKVENCSVIYWEKKDDDVTSSYVGHVVPSEGSGKAVAKAIFDFFKDRDTDTSKLSIIFTDGCSKMTGWKTGAVSELEELLSKPLQRFVCILHHAELPFSHLFTHYDGPTLGPETFSGPIGKSICEDVWKLPLVDFEVMDNPQLLQALESIPAEVFSDLSKDHQYLLKMLEGVLTGNLPEQWCNMKAGPIVHSRWTNPQSRLLRLYMSSENPSFGMRRLCSFVVFVYSPVFLSAKHFQGAEEGPKILVQELKAVRLFCLEEEQQVVQPVIRTNGFYGHGENVLVSLLCSSDREDRQFSIQRIKEIRELEKKKNIPRGRKKIRQFKVPEDFNFNAETVYDLTDLTKLTTEPPITKSLSEIELENFVLNPLKLGLPSSTVAVERGVKLTTEAAKVTSDPVLQDGVSFQKIAARQKSNLKNILINFFLFSIFTRSSM